ncbi:MAG: biotin/lipoyl-containing protein [Pseudomonadota bacterium]
MSHEVIMPALGMAQDTGLIVAWLKRPGDPVSEGDALIEVETDKATMEVEAGRSGYLAAVLAEDGDEVPVGQVIAVISDTAPEAPVRRAFAPGGAEPVGAEPTGVGSADARPAGADWDVREEVPRPVTAREADAAVPVTTVDPACASGRILASPKARRLAAEQGLALTDLVAAGHPQPFHVADLEALRRLPTRAAAPELHAAPRPSEISAEVPTETYDAFRAWLAAEHEAPPDGPRLLAAFAAGAYRAASGSIDQAILVSAYDVAPRGVLRDPDLHALTDPLDAVGEPSHLIVRDLTGTAIRGLRPGYAPVPSLTLTRAGDTLALHLVHDAEALPPEAALALVTGVAARLTDPLRHLL